MSGRLDADRREWDDLARLDARWAVLSEPGRRGSWDDEAFFASGEEEVAAIVGGLRERGLLERCDRALDFGCGIGRLTRALGDRFGEVVGVDISPAMVERARRLHADRPACRFLANDRPDLALLPDDHFDLVLSLIALQHVTDADLARDYLRELVRVTAPGGTLVLQMPTAVGRRVRLHPLRLLNRALRRVPRVPAVVLRRLVGHSMRLTALPEPEVRAVLAASGAEVVASMPDRRTGSDAVPSRSYVARKAPGAASLRAP